MATGRAQEGAKSVAAGVRCRRNPFGVRTRNPKNAAWSRESFRTGATTCVHLNGRYWIRTPAGIQPANHGLARRWRTGWRTRPAWRTSRGGAPLTSWPAPSHAPKGSMPLARCPTVTPPFRHRGSLGRNDSVGRCGETWQSGHPFMEGQPRATSATRLLLDRRNDQGFRRPVEQT